MNKQDFEKFVGREIINTEKEITIYILYKNSKEFSGMSLDEFSAGDTLNEDLNGGFIDPVLLKVFEDGAEAMTELKNNRPYSSIAENNGIVEATEYYISREEWALYGGEWELIMESVAEISKARRPDWIKYTRIKAGLSQAKMSKLTGIPQRTIEDWDVNRVAPPPWAERLIIKELEEISKNNRK